MRQLLTIAMLGAIGVSLGACQTTGSGTPQVTCETVKFVWLSRKDVLTKDSLRQIVANNGALVSLCGRPEKWK